MRVLLAEDGAIGRPGHDPEAALEPEGDAWVVGVQYLMARFDGLVLTGGEDVLLAEEHRAGLPVPPPRVAASPACGRTGRRARAVVR